MKKIYKRLIPYRVRLFLWANIILRIVDLYNGAVLRYAINAFDRPLILRLSVGHSDFRSDGFVIKRQMALGKLDGAEVDNALEMLKRGAHCTNRGTTFELENPLLHIPSISVLLADTTLRSVISDYLGDDAVLTGIRLWRTWSTKGGDVETVNNKWHFDLATRRLKVFVYLTGDEGTQQPTLTVPGSHFKNMRLPQSYAASRVEPAEEYIELSGGAWDILFLDTMTSHRGVFDREYSPRNVLIMDFMSVRKYRLLSKYLISRLSALDTIALKVPINFESSELMPQRWINRLDQHTLKYIVT